MRVDERRLARVSAVGRPARPNGLMLASMVSTTPKSARPIARTAPPGLRFPHPGPGGVTFIPAILAAGPRSLPAGG